MKERVPKMCITCKNYKETYECGIDDSYIGYLYCDIPTKCKEYRLMDEYKRGGKWYDSRKDVYTLKEVCDIAGITAKDLINVPTPEVE